MEIEAKFICNDFEIIKQKAIEQGFELKKKKHQIDTYFIVNKIIDNRRSYLRIREDKIKDTLSLDFHQVLSLLETEEYESDISSKEAIEKLLESLGYKIICVVNKKREQYTDGKFTLTFDSVVSLGNFVELEIESQLNEELNKEFYDMCQKLNLNEDDRIKKKGYPDLLIEKKEKSPKVG